VVTLAFPNEMHALYEYLTSVHHLTHRDLVLSSAQASRTTTARSRATLDEIRRTAGAFSTRHRIVDTRGDVHHVVVVGDQIFDDAGEVIGTHGFYVDVTPSMQEVHDEIVTEAVAEIAEARSGIEQAKGMLMLIYRINADSAFELLRWRSRRPTPSCGCSPSKLPRTSSIFPTTRCCLPGACTTGCC
jgi:fructose-specific component phosphotransferase system IIB-like protein